MTGYDGENIIEIGKADIGRIYRLCSHLDKLVQKISKAKVHRQKRKLSKAAQKLRNLVDECHRQAANYLTKEYKIIFLPTFEISQMVVKKGRKLATKTARAMLTWSHYRTPNGIYLTSGESFKHQSDKTKINLGGRIIKGSFKVFNQAFTSLHPRIGSFYDPPCFDWNKTCFAFLFFLKFGWFR